MNEKPVLKIMIDNICAKRIIGLSDGVFTIGSDINCEIHLENIAEQHCQLEIVHGEYWIKSISPDLELMLNCNRIENSKFYVNDIINIGKYSISIQNESAISKKLSDQIQIGTIREIVNGNSYKEYQDVYDNFTFGRHRECNCELSDDIVSLLHCKIGIINKRPFLIDINSSNGTEVDGKRIKSNKSQLYNNSEITIGSRSFIFQSELASELKSTTDNETTFLSKINTPKYRRIAVLSGVLILIVVSILFKKSGKINNRANGNEIKSINDLVEKGYLLKANREVKEILHNDPKNQVIIKLKEDIDKKSENVNKLKMTYVIEHSEK